MKKRVLSLLLVILSIMSLLAGCSAQTTNEITDASAISDTKDQQQAVQGEGNAEGTANTEPGKGRPDIFGKVKNIVGNEVTLLVAEMPEMPQKAEGDEDTAPRADRSESSTGTQAAPRGFTGGPSGMRPEGNQPITRDLSTLNFTGETRTLLIPVAAPVISGSAGQDAEESDFTDIEVGDILRIWLDDEENVVQVSLQKAES